jgi:hypothetical protein
MYRKRAIPTGAIRRQCPDCLQIFGFMTDTQLAVVWPSHLRSIRHNKWIDAKNSAADRAAREADDRRKEKDRAASLARARATAERVLPRGGPITGI